MQKEIKVHTSVNDINKDSWASLVQISPVASWFQTQEAYRFFDSLSFLEAFCIAVESDSVLKGVVVGYIQKDGGKIKQFFSRRAIINGGPLLANDISDEELTTLLNATKQVVKRKSIYVETRNFNDYGRWRKVFEKCGFLYEPHYDYLIDCTTYESLWKKLKENRRRQIKKAIKEGVIIEEASSEEDVLSFYYILKDLYDNKVKTPLFPEEFFLSFYNEQQGKFLLVKCDGVVCGGIMCPILDNRYIYEWFVCGKDFVYKNKYPSVMATWAAIDYANKNRIVNFDFMGAGKPSDGGYGVRDFKSKFGGELVEFGRFKHVCNKKLFVIGIIGVKLLKKNKKQG